MTKRKRENENLQNNRINELKNSWKLTKQGIYLDSGKAGCIT